MQQEYNLTPDLAVFKVCMELLSFKILFPNSDCSFSNFDRRAGVYATSFFGHRNVGKYIVLPASLYCHF